MTQNFDLMGFIGHLEKMTVAIELETHHSLERAAKVVEHEAKAEIGTYQSAVGPFPAWAPLSEFTLDGYLGFPGKIGLGYSPPDNPLLREGDLRDSIGHVVEGHEAVVGSDEDKAVWSELGTVHQPPRSFLGGAAAREATKVAEILGEGVVAVIAGTRAI